MEEIADELPESAGVELGLQFLSEAHETFALVANQPEMGWAGNVRRSELRTVKTFRVSERFRDYLIFYLPCKSRIEILSAAWVAGSAGVVCKGGAGAKDLRSRDCSVFMHPQLMTPIAKQYIV